MSLTADEVNILVYRYLEESGFAHTAFSFVAESQITKSPTAKVKLPPGALLAFLQKGLQYTEIEAHLNEDGTAVPFENEFSLLTPYLPKGGLQPPKSSPTHKRKFNFNKGRKKGHKLHESSTHTFDPSVSEAAVLPLTGHQGPVYRCLWNPVRSIIASCSEDATVRIWHLPGLANWGRCARQESGKISSSAISLDHRNVHERSVGMNGNGSLEDQSISGASSNTTSAGSKASVTVLDWSPDGQQLATGCNDGPVRIWEFNNDGVSMKFIRGMPKKRGTILALRWSPDGTLIAGGSDAEGGVTVWDAADGTVVREYAAHKCLVSDLCWMNSGPSEKNKDFYFATCSAEHMIYVFSTASSRVVRTLSGHKDEINSLQWSPNGMRLLSASDDCNARVWDLQSLLEHKEDGSAADISESESADIGVMILQGHHKQVYSARWSSRKQDLGKVLNKKVAPNGDNSKAISAATSKSVSKELEYLVATASYDHAIKLWDPTTGSCLRTLTRHSNCVYSVAFSPNGLYLASGSYDSEVLVWDVTSGAIMLSYLHEKALNSDTPGIFDVRWNKSGDKVAASFADKTIRVLDFDGYSDATKGPMSKENDASTASTGGANHVIKRSRH